MNVGIGVVRRVAALDEELAAFEARLGAAFGRAEVRGSAAAFIDGLLSGIARKTGWQPAEEAGLAGPLRMQSLLGRSVWDADALRDLVRAEVLQSLGDAAGVLVVDETGFLNKGTFLGVWRGNIPVLQVVSKTVRLVFFSAMPAVSVQP